ncbi:MAG: phosphate/phosphite/phosphonate ABC transporter substrate-binding protein [Candidatus Eisenbacteria bacterium]|uniref:Phosphate/phosphite/phosphonate ABC transporter substrate-binding protein n=1 Tax=Eiseniibacteriota bacterium TaxID=2212470 RepID=A0A948RXP7_UNCEI|nr:phosphate/phosphite/phosphonate ABC transporter substrate-binding protein [Candidatus Eisenbacteria bacterium]MBU1950274.1 phosphate/phosphite/phosphonate ABC transporter substrate-binding protein [Candidatus Eisenbacteria bacterium]MBU2691514.1 phosphate/phosphite/phosphonate ABC transporter substrate-binding protein [Candidatus Eisenbacteria bacterium]
MEVQTKVAALFFPGLRAGILGGMCLLAVLMLFGRAAGAQEDVIDLSDLSPPPAPPPSEVPPLRVAVSNVLSPQGTVESYGLLLKYLGDKMNRPIELVQRRTYLETNELIRASEVDLAFVCTSSYVVGHEQFGMQLLAVPVVHGATTYHAVLIVHHNNPAESMEDLKGSIFAFTDPLSHTGHNYPKFLIRQLGETPESFFGKTIYTYSHDTALQAVADGSVDAACLHSIVLGFALKRDPKLAGKIKQIHQSPPFGMPPVVIGPGVDPALVAQLREILIGMKDDPEGKRALALIDYDAFVTIEDKAYDSIRVIFRAVGVLETPEP